MELYRQIVYISYWFFFCSMIYDCGRIARDRSRQKGSADGRGWGGGATRLYYVRGGDGCPAIVYETRRRAHENVINTVGSAAFRVCNLAARESRTRPTVRRSAVFASLATNFFEKFFPLKRVLFAYGPIGCKRKRRRLSCL